VVKEFYCAIKGGSTQIRRERDDANLILGGNGLEPLKVAIALDLYRTIGNIDVCTSLSCLTSKYPSFFSARGVLATQGGTSGSFIACLYLNLLAYKVGFKAFEI
jgi:hypothetical protein